MSSNNSSQEARKYISKFYLQLLNGKLTWPCPCFLCCLLGVVCICNLAISSISMRCHHLVNVYIFLKRCVDCSGWRQVRRYHAQHSYRCCAEIASGVQTWEVQISCHINFHAIPAMDSVVLCGVQREHLRRHNLIQRFVEEAFADEIAVWNIGCRESFYELLTHATFMWCERIYLSVVMTAGQY